MSQRKPPKHLAPATAKWWTSVVREYELEPHHVRLLTLAAESWDRGVEARRAVDTHGLVYSDRFGQPRTRPEIAVERDSRLAFARLIRELDLDIDAPAEAARSPALRSCRPASAAGGE